MAIPSYTSDLIDITTAEGGTWGEITGFAQGGTPAIETDYYIQGTACYSQSTAGKTGLNVSMFFDFGSDLAASITTGKVVFYWQILTAANGMDTFNNGGLRLGIGSSAADFRQWISGGNDFGRNPYGGWQNVAIDPRYNNSTPDYTVGTPTGVWRYFCSHPNLTASIGKGSPHALDAIRYGRGQVIITGGTLADGYCNFTGMFTINDNQTNRWGLFQKEGVGYLWKGLLSFGLTGLTQACEFVDSNKNITIENTPRTYVDFNKIEIRNTGSTISWTAVNLSALNQTQLSRGKFEMIDNALVTLDTCVFTDMSTFIFKSRASIIGSTFRRCELVTQSGATFTSSTFANSTGVTSVLSNDLSKFSYCEFISDGSNHAIEITSTGTYNFIGNIFTNYATISGTTGNEAIYNTSGGLVTINVSDSASSPSYRNDGASTTVVNNNVSITLTGMKDNTEVRVFAAGTTTELAGIENATDGTLNNRSFTFSLAVGLHIDYRLVNFSYIIIEVYDYTTPASSTSLPIQQQSDRWVI